jgi:soluble cytochrome b562
MPKKTEKEELEELKKDNMALLKSALKQARMNKELTEAVRKLVDINKKLTNKLKKKNEGRKKSRS